ncbi:MAG: cyclic nucleotide-binding domain-containing protein [Halofilum sp. (in: g-proteobacteria)]|nr:cyclic nucleotide-binding domain-containing protein [Halofilum sp. (in: g-proteobacteria)]
MTPSARARSTPASTSSSSVRSACARAASRIETLGKGDCFGEMGFLAETRRSASITADSDTVVLRVSQAAARPRAAGDAAGLLS